MLLLLTLLVASAAFGALFALMKGTGGGWHLVAGNMSAPWLVLPILAGATASRRLLFAGLFGGVSALLGLLSFYLTTATLWHLVNAETERNNLTFVVAGTVGAAAVSAVGSKLGGRGRATLLGALFVLEPLAWIGYDRFERIPNDDARSTAVLFALEVAVGLALIAVARASGARTAR